MDKTLKYGRLLFLSIRARTWKCKANTLAFEISYFHRTGLESKTIIMSQFFDSV